MNRRVIAWAGCAVIGIALAAVSDARIARAMNEWGIDEYLRTHDVLRESVKAPGTVGMMIGIAVILAFVHRGRWRTALFFVLATIPVSFNQVLRWVIGRTRPYKIDELGNRLAPFELHPFRTVKNLCFPSGHAALAFAVAALLGMLWPRLRWLWYSVACIVTIERFAENAHWFSDCVAGAALGISGAYLAAWLMKSWKINPLTSRS